MATIAHRVRRQSWHLRVGSATDAFAARSRFRVEVEDLLPAFNDVFGTWAPDETILHIPRLEIELRVTSLDELAGALGEALRDALGDEPPRGLPVARASVTTGAEALDVLLRFLETGTLAWHAAHLDPMATTAGMRATLLTELQTVAARTPAHDASFERAWQCYVRLLQLLPDERWSELSAALAAIGSRRSAGIEEGVPPVAGAAAMPRPAGEALAAAIVAILDARARLGRHAALALAAATLATARMRPLSRQDLYVEFSRTLGPDALSDAPRVVAQFFGAAFGAHRATTFESSRASSPPPRGEEGAYPEAAPTPSRPGETGARPDAGTQTFALAVANAGLVLLHPFLPALFEECGLYDRERSAHDARRGLEPGSLPRAAALLHWLATGRDEVHEFELGAVKLLLGLRAETPLPATTGLLGERERDEGRALLHAAIGHWKALKGTSIEGLRISFLQRRAALREDEAGWRLDLEAESFDVLLKQLPWGIATVKLPWMTRPLFANWPTR